MAYKQDPMVVVQEAVPLLHLVGQGVADSCPEACERMVAADSEMRAGTTKAGGVPTSQAVGRTSTGAAGCAEGC